MAIGRGNNSNTWWGERWLKSLSEIDYSNRLPRGKTYANKGAVYALEINGNEIHADVSGSFRNSYKVRITVPQLEREQKLALVDAVVNDDLVLAKLMNMQMPKELEQVCKNHGVALFPSRWDDLKMKCSCPDHAVPCKHLAAVIYKLSEEINRNPFLILKLKGLDLPKSLKQQGIEMESFQGHFFELKKHMEELSIRGESYYFDKNVFEEIDFSNLVSVQERMFAILNDKPLFYSKDFKSVLKKAYNATGKSYKNFHKSIQEQETPAFWHKAEALQIIVKPNNKLAWYYQIEGEYVPLPQTYQSPKMIQSLILSQDASKMSHWLKEWKVLYALSLYVSRILLEKTFVPQVEKIGNKFHCRWIPLLMDKASRNIFENMSKLLPPDLLLLQQESGFERIKAEEQLNILVDWYVGGWVRENAFDLRGSGIDTDQLVFDAFFEEEPVGFDEELSSSVPDAIHLWLQKLFITEKELVPVFWFDERSDGDFSMKLKVKERKSGFVSAFDELLKKHRNKKAKLGLFKDLNLVSEYFPKINKFLSSEKKNLLFPIESFENFLFDILPTIRLLGIEVILPKSIQRMMVPTLTMEVQKHPDASPAKLNIMELLNFEWRISIGEDTFLTEDDFRAMVKGKKGLIRFKDMYVHLQADEVNKLLRKLDNPPKLGANEVLQAAFSESYEGCDIVLSDEAKELLEQFTQDYEVETAENLQAVLRPYQERGYAWLYKNARLGLGSILADDMGLGKTLQTISALAKFKEDGLLSTGKVLIIVPTSLMTNWDKEIARFAPMLEVKIYHGPGRKLEGDYDCLVTTYGMARTDLSKLKKKDWYALIIDEAQNIKNASTAQTKAVKSIPASVKIALSGTPVENRLSEYWSIMDFANKGYLGTVKKFVDHYAKPIQEVHDHDVLERFKKMTSPFLLRRLKTDKTIITDLPDKIEQNVYCALTEEQASIYQATVEKAMKAIGGADEGIEKKGMVLSMITSLKQVCNHPAQFLKGKMNKPEYSGKTDQLFAVLDSVFETEEKVLIFTQYTEMGNMLQNWIDERYHTHSQFLHGGLSRKERDHMVDRFQNDPDCRVFVLSLKAAGTGLNLTQASHVVHYDLWWNPAVEAQATDRAYRIGQKRNVMVHRLICQGTFEEKIDEMIRTKRKLSDLTVAAGEKWIGDMSDSDLNELVSYSSQ
ncbi:SNF2-related protein [Aureibacter tunicatorum]|uniref:Zn finger protein/superfamily II DNA or RNA helicase n=1 Tax=Aureibacter tunicatorum TaxID=866807 RepID=A0AAE4BRF3_9BACT|nr:SNF2-related protein [Aureibacter tunicatorum]MDR6237883.1 putative Zn finger protein/superfamily II DNA or RNA helicase [Aureibacter tunicatorum]BDD02918.1 helicase [Aureibacter tunicatorum]